MHADTIHNQKRFLLTISFIISLLSQAFLSACSSAGTDRVAVSATPQTAAVTTSATLDINAASVQELERLPGIGPKTAEAIVAHRNTFGEFRRIENVMLVEGMSTERFNDIRGLIRAEQHTDARR